MIEWFKTLLQSFVATPLPTMFVVLLGAFGWLAKNYIAVITKQKDEMLTLVTSMLQRTEKNTLIVDACTRQLEANEDVLLDVRTQMDKILNRKPRATGATPIVPGGEKP